LKQAAFKKEESSSDRQELAKFEDELQLVKVRNLGQENLKMNSFQRLEEFISKIGRIETSSI
jgi:hypothetical protein